MSDRAACLACKSLLESSNRHKIAYLACAEGHRWVGCRTHGIAPVQQPPDGSAERCGRCLQVTLTEEDTGYRLGTYKTCPTCKGAWESACRCRIGHLTCENGHDWVNCPTHGPTPAYQPPDGSHAYCAQCAKKVVTEEDTSYWTRADPLRRHDMLLSVGVDPYKTRRYRDFDWHELPFQIQTSLAGKLKLAEEGTLWDRTEARERREMMQQAQFLETEITPYLKTTWSDLPEVMRNKLRPLFRNRNRTQQESTTCRLLGELFET